MAEGLLRAMAGGRVKVYSAGTMPSSVNTLAVKAMSEIAIDISGHRSKSISEFSGQKFDYVITVCDKAKNSCPVFGASANRISWSFKDPAEAEGDDKERMIVFREVRDQLKEQISDFLKNGRFIG